MFSVQTGSPGETACTYTDRVVSSELIDRYTKHAVKDHMKRFRSSTSLEESCFPAFQTLVQGAVFHRPQNFVPESYFESTLLCCTKTLAFFGFPLAFMWENREFMYRFASVLGFPAASVCDIIHPFKNLLSKDTPLVFLRKPEWNENRGSQCVYSMFYGCSQRLCSLRTAKLWTLFPELILGNWKIWSRSMFRWTWSSSYVMRAFRKRHSSGFYHGWQYRPRTTFPFLCHPPCSVVGWLGLYSYFNK